VRSWRTLLGLAVSAIFLYIAFRGQDFGEIRDALKEANLWWMPAALTLYFVGVWIRAVRWRLLLRPVVSTRSRDLLPIVVVGYMANNVLPFRAGEIVRSFLLGRKYGVRKTSALATIAVERIFDGLTMLTFIAFSMIFVSLTSELRHLALFAFILFAGLLIGLFLLTLGGSLFDRLLQLVLGPLPTRISDRVERMLGSFLGGLGIFRHRRDLALVVLTSLLAWLFEASMYYTLALGFGAAVRDTMGVAATLLTTGVANMSTLIPGSPGYVGQFEFGVKLVLNGALGVPEGQALAYAILVHAALYFPITILGVLEWSRQQLTLSQIRAETDEPAAGQVAVQHAPSKQAWSTDGAQGP
jgi:glycosyltransferase 2 family protein